VEGVAHLPHIYLRFVDGNAQVDRGPVGEDLDWVRAAGAELRVRGARDEGAGQKGAGEECRAGQRTGAATGCPRCHGLPPDTR